MRFSARQDRPPPNPTLGIRANLSQFILLIIVNAFVGAMVGMERSILPAIAEEEFLLVARTAVLSFIVVFGITKAITKAVTKAVTKVEVGAADNEFTYAFE